MGDPLPSRRLQVRGGGLTSPRLIARVVPDVSGLDRAFDYLVPERLSATATVGAVVRIPLHGRRVKGWVIARSDETSPSIADGEAFHGGELQEIHDVRGNGVIPDLVPLAGWAARRWFGPVRSILTTASAPRLRDLVGTPQRSLSAVPAAAHASATPSVHLGPPGRSVIALALRALDEGPALLICPTVEMAARGAAWLRKQGAVTAEHPHEWSRAAGGVDVVVGSRSAVWAPVPDLATIIVVDEHDTSHVESRVPMWSAPAVALERARRSGARLVLSSPAPSLSAVAGLVDGSLAIHPASSLEPWGEIHVADMGGESENGGVPSTLLGRTLLEECRDDSRRVGIVLNSNDEAVRSRCLGCGHRPECGSCRAGLVLATGGMLSCRHCSAATPAVCPGCGGTRLTSSRPGYRGLAADLRKGTRREVAVLAASDSGGSTSAGVVVGTEAVLNRVHPLDTVVLADADAWLGSSRLGAVERLWGLVIRALRVTSDGGRVVVQTRRPDHPAVRALAGVTVRGSDAYLGWARAELETRTRLSLPPAVPSALVQTEDLSVWDAIVLPESVRRASLQDGVLLAGGPRGELETVLRRIKAAAPRARISVDPRDI